MIKLSTLLMIYQLWRQPTKNQFNLQIMIELLSIVLPQESVRVTTRPMMTVLGWLTLLAALLCFHVFIVLVSLPPAPPRARER